MSITKLPAAEQENAALAKLFASDETVEVTYAGYAFTLRRDVGWFEEEGEQGAALRMYLANEAIASGQVRSAGELSYRVDAAGRDLAKLENRLVKWTVPLPLDRENIRRMSAPLKAALMAEIAKLEQGEVMPAEIVKSN